MHANDSALNGLNCHCSDHLSFPPLTEEKWSKEQRGSCGVGRGGLKMPPRSQNSQNKEAGKLPQLVCSWDRSEDEFHSPVNEIHSEMLYNCKSLYVSQLSSERLSRACKMVPLGQQDRKEEHGGGAEKKPP